MDMHGKPEGIKVRGVLRVTEVRLVRDTPLSSEELVAAILRGLAVPVFRSNLVVDIGLQALTALLGGGQGSPPLGVTPATFGDLAVEEMRITDQATPTAPAAVDWGLEGTPVYTFNVQPGVADGTLVVTYPSTGHVKFSGLIPLGVAIANPLTEEGLFSYNNKLIARTTFSKKKESSFALQFDHTIEIARV
jgi:hypothetical protein